jgi:signal transduction histidine kinase
MRLRLWPFVSLSFCGLLLLVPLFGWVVSRKAVQLAKSASQAHRAYQQVDDAITDIRSDIHTSTLLLRGAGVSPLNVPIRDRILGFRSSERARLKTLRLLLPAAEQPKLQRLERELSSYWDSVMRKASQIENRDTSSRAAAMGRDDQREAVLEVAEQIDGLNAANFALEEQDLEGQQYELKRFAALATGALLVFGLFIAGGSTLYLARLERTSGKQKQRAEHAELELRRLSNKLVRAQEDERKIISRELHDEVGQILTGLRMELGGLSKGEGDGTFRARLDSIKALAEDALRAVRNLALLLRPSMLDDLGLGAALRWQAKEISRRSGIPVSVEIKGDLDRLDETHRICLYRVVQEALTNCTKHSEATRIAVRVRQENGLVSASIQDNGRGFQENSDRSRGLGLVGLEERVRALQGNVTISSQAGWGALIRVDLPAMPRDQEESLKRDEQV